MLNNSSTTVSQAAKILFFDFMQLSIPERKAHIEKHSPNMADWQKRAVLH